jgi:hypothetical protein
MTTEATVNALLVAGVVVLLVRILVGLAYVLRTSRVWTFALPTVALLIYFVRAIIGRVTDLDIGDWALVWTLGFVVFSQALACLYQWAPVSPKRSPKAGK